MLRCVISANEAANVPAFWSTEIMSVVLGYVESVDAANQIASEIVRLAGAGKSTSGFHMGQKDNF
jgi:hypothetical protein